MLLLITPAAAILIAFQVVPIVIGANASSVTDALRSEEDLVGLAHYAAVLTDRAFLTIVLPNTFMFMAVSVGAALVLGLSWPCCSTAVPRPEARADNPVDAADGGAGDRGHHAALDVQRPVRDRERGPRGARLRGQPWMAQRWTAFSVIVLTDVWL